MKDIIINLQMALITSLQEALQTDLELNYESLLIASDNARTNAVVCLGQLHQRLASQSSQSRQPSHVQTTELPAATAVTQTLPSRPDIDIDIPENPYRPTSPQPPPPYDPSSTDPPVELPTTGRNNHNTAAAPRNREADDRTSPTPKPRRSSSISSTFSFSRRRFFPPKETEHPRDQGVDHEQHPIIPVNEYSSEQDYRAGQAPEAVSPRQFRSPSHPADPTQIVSPISQPSRSSRGWTFISGRSFYSPEDVTNNNPWTNPFSPTSDRNISRGLNTPPPNGPQPDVQQTSNPGSSSLIVASSPRGSSSNNTLSRNIATRGSTSGTSTTSSTNEGLTPYSSGSTSVSKSPYMPSKENNYAGFCKGAWRLQNNMDGMTAEHRPSGMYGEIRFWKCCKCRFDGPLFGGNSKSTRKFDTKVRVDISGVRYRWVFLAKSHVQQKQEPTVSDGTGGSFRCIFCCAEWKEKAPVFNDLELFMDHLQIHREQVLSPELIYRTKCIVGRIAADSEDFDINLPPKAQEIG